MDKSIRITILSENTVGQHWGLLGEHGFSALVEVGGNTFLFDTGQGHVILNNISLLGIDINNINLMFLSHGHWDHCGGILDVLNSRKGGMEIHCHTDVFQERYYLQDGIMRFAGIPYSKLHLESVGAKFFFNNNVLQIVDNVYLTGSVPMLNDFEFPASQLFTKINDKLIGDVVYDEQSMVIAGNKGLVIIVGCSHPGIVNIIRYAQQITGILDIQAIIGGTHLMFHEDKQIMATISALAETSPHTIAAAHCTGTRANGFLRTRFADSFVDCKVGTVLYFE